MKKTIIELYNANEHVKPLKYIVINGDVTCFQMNDRFTYIVHKGVGDHETHYINLDKEKGEFVQVRNWGL